VRDTGGVTSARDRRLAAGMLGVLAAALLVAGSLPWAGSGPLAVRLIALPLLLLGALAAVVAARLPTMASPLRRTASPAARPLGCANCACGTAPQCRATTT
jgi:hypothetical protein